MAEEGRVFQRSETGRAEIHEKKCGLTQSERLVLIMIDGVSTQEGVRAKLPVLTDERFRRAIRTLQQKDLIQEVLMPLADQRPEEVERSVIDRFLQQDPLDPVTIIMRDDDERLTLPPFVDDAPTSGRVDDDGWSEHASIQPSSAMPAPDPSPVTEEDAQRMRLMQEEDDSRMAEEIGEQARARLLEDRKPRPSEMFSPPPYGELARTRATDRVWPYWVMAIVGAFILGFAVARTMA